MMHFGIKEISYSVNFDESVYKYEESDYKKMFSVSFWSSYISIQFKPSITKINAFDLFSVEKQGGHTTKNHFATIHAGRTYVIRLRFMRSRKILSINLTEDGFQQYFHNNHFLFPSASFGFIKKKDYNKIKIHKIETD